MIWDIIAYLLCELTVGDGLTTECNGDGVVAGIEWCVVDGYSTISVIFYVNVSILAVRRADFTLDGAGTSISCVDGDHCFLADHNGWLLSLCGRKQILSECGQRFR